MRDGYRNYFSETWCAGQKHWLGSLDSNQERMIQSHLCYHYTTSQHVEILRGYYTIKYGHCPKVSLMSLNENKAYFSIALLILAQVSRKDTVRLNTSFSAEESVVSTKKYPSLSN